MAPDLVASVASRLQGRVKTRDRVVVGLSGGVDSVVLLDVLQTLARRRRFTLSAIHVNHQLSPNAARWAAFCRRICRDRGIPLRVVKVEVPRGDSVESAARDARYREFWRLSADFIALAHNQDDQAETLLLQLLRGAGVKGLAAMPFARSGERGVRKGAAPLLLRPLLDVPRSEIEHHARERGLEWVEDESNDDIRFSRNFLRREVLPVLASRFPAYRKTLARSAGHLAEATELLDELARLDAGDRYADGALQLAALRVLPRARARNLLRWFLARRGAEMPSARRLDEALHQVLAARSDARVCVDLGARELRRFAGALHVVGRLKAPGAAFCREWRGEQTLDLPELGGVLHTQRGRGGISLARLAAAPVTVRLRRGGERLRPHEGRPSRTLKNLLQEARLPPWQRERLPFLYCGSRLAWVAGVGVDAAFRARGGEPSIVPDWRPY